MDAIGCLVSNTADDFFSSRLLKKDFNQMLNQALLMQPTQVSTDFVANFGLLRIMSDSARDSFQAFAHHHVKWLCCSIQLWAHTLFSERLRFLSDALHRIWFATYRFVPVPYFISETLADEWSKDWVKQWALLGSAISSCKFHCYSISNEKKIYHCQKNYRALNPYWILNLVITTRVAALVV